MTITGNLQWKSNWGWGEMSSAEVWQSLRGEDWLSWIKHTHLRFPLGSVWNRASTTCNVILSLTELDGVKINWNRHLFLAYITMFKSMIPKWVCLLLWSFRFLWTCMRAILCFSTRPARYVCVYVNMHERIHAGMRMNIWSAGYWPICRCEYVCACKQTRTVLCSDNTKLSWRFFSTFCTSAAFYHLSSLFDSRSDRKCLPEWKD